MNTQRDRPRDLLLEAGIRVVPHESSHSAHPVGETGTEGDALRVKIGETLTSKKFSEQGEGE